MNVIHQLCENFYYTLLLNITIIIKNVFQYSLSVLKMYSLCYIYNVTYIRFFSILAVIIGKQLKV